MATSILDLEEVVIEQVLDYLAPTSRELIDIDDKRSMSVESFATVSDPVDHSLHRGIEALYDVFKNNFEQYPRFKVPLLRRKYARVDTRFSAQGFDELNTISQDTTISKYVLKFSYMVHGFSSLGISDFEKLMDENRSTSYHPDPAMSYTNIALGANAQNTIRNMMQRTREQNSLIQSNSDQVRLQIALQSFKNLQQIRLMHIQDQTERNWNSFVRARGISHESEQHRWARASEHAAKSLGQAYLSARSSASRISFRNLQTSILVSKTPQENFASQLQHLSSMEILFDNRSSLDADILEFSTIFRQGFTSATNLKGLHLGFMRPVTTPFGAIFHDVYWSTLRYFGIGPWHLTSDDIITFLLRHRESLKCVRLRGVLLKDGSEWLDVVRTLRRDFGKLKWVSLRSVGYSNEVPVHEYHQGDDDSSDDDEYLSEGSESTAAEESGGEGQASSMIPDNREQDLSEAETDGESDDEESYHGSASDDSEPGDFDHGVLDDQEMLRHITSRPDLAAKCHCNTGFAWDDLESDEHRTPPKHLWKFWQLWISRRCEKHDPPPIAIAGRPFGH